MEHSLYLWTALHLQKFPWLTPGLVLWTLHISSTAVKRPLCHRISCLQSLSSPSHITYLLASDCTCPKVISPAIAVHLCSWLNRPNCNVVTPNKQLGAGPISHYKAVTSACHHTGNQFFYEVRIGTPPVCLEIVFQPMKRGHLMSFQNKQ